MNHYPHHIGDFNNATRHLTRVERSLYRDLIELYYDAEQPLNRDIGKLARRVLASSDEERVALEIVLDEFFTLEEDGWHNTRCDAEIEKYRGSVEQASRAGKASAAKRYNNKATSVQRPSNDRSTNQNQNQNQNQGNTPLAPQGGAPDGAGGVEQAADELGFAAQDDAAVADDAAAELPPSAGSACTTAGSVCLALKAAGIADTNPGNPKLRALIAAGADLQEFVGAAQDAAARGNPRFAYVLGSVAGERQRAAEMCGQLHAGPLPTRRVDAAAAAETFRERDQRLAAEHIASVLPGIAARPVAPARPGTVIDVTPTPTFPSLAA